MLRFLLLFSLLVLPATTLAQGRISVEGDVASPVSEWLDKPAWGGGVRLRAGYTFSDTPLFELTPELMGQYFALVPGQHGEADYTLYSFSGGLRLTPTVFKDMRLDGGLTVDVGYSMLDGLGSDYSITEYGVSLHAGLHFAVKVQPWLRLGAQLNYNVLFHHDNPNPSLPSNTMWLGGGLHVELLLHP